MSNDRPTVAANASGPPDDESNRSEVLLGTEDESWVPPEETRGTLGYALRSTESYRGSVVDAGRNREFVYMSRLERDFLQIALARDDVAEIVEQPPGAVWRDGAGKTHDHTFEAHLIMTGGRRVEVDVKPRSKLDRTGIASQQRAVAEQHGTAVADVFVVRTEDHLHPDDVRDARWILRARRMPDERADTVIADAVSRLHGWCRLADFVDDACPGPSGFNAVVRAVARGLLEVRDRRRISADCLIRRKTN